MIKDGLVDKPGFVAIEDLFHHRDVNDSERKVSVMPVKIAQPHDKLLVLGNLIDLLV